MRLKEAFKAHLHAVENYLDELEDITPERYSPTLTESWFMVAGTRASLRDCFESPQSLPSTKSESGEEGS